MPAARRRSPGMMTVLMPLPLFYNPDARGRRKRIEDAKLVATAEEVTKMLGGATLHCHRDRKPRGFWWDRGFVDFDVHALLEIDAPDTGAVLSRLKSYARRVLLRRFDQKAIYMKVVRPIEQILVTREVVS